MGPYLRKALGELVGAPLSTVSLISAVCVNMDTMKPAAAAVGRALYPVLGGWDDGGSGGGSGGRAVAAAIIPGALDASYSSTDLVNTVDPGATGVELYWVLPGSPSFFTLRKPTATFSMYVSAELSDLSKFTLASGASVTTTKDITDALQLQFSRVIGCSSSLTTTTTTTTMSNSNNSSFVTKASASLKSLSDVFYSIQDAMGVKPYIGMWNCSISPVSAEIRISMGSATTSKIENTNSSAGAISGIAVAVLLVLIGLVFALIERRRRKKQEASAIHKRSPLLAKSLQLGTGITSPIFAASSPRTALDSAATTLDFFPISAVLPDVMNTSVQSNKPLASHLGDNSLVFRSSNPMYPISPDDHHGPEKPPLSRVLPATLLPASPSAQLHLASTQPSSPNSPPTFISVTQIVESPSRSSSPQRSPSNTLPPFESNAPPPSFSTSSPLFARSNTVSSLSAPSPTQIKHLPNLGIEKSMPDGSNELHAGVAIDDPRPFLSLNSIVEGGGLSASPNQHIISSPSYEERHSVSGKRETLTSGRTLKGFLQSRNGPGNASPFSALLSSSPPSATLSPRPVDADLSFSHLNPLMQHKV